MEQENKRNQTTIKIAVGGNDISTPHPTEPSNKISLNLGAHMQVNVIEGNQLLGSAATSSVPTKKKVGKAN